MTTTTIRPVCVRDEHLTYLDELRASGITNMFGEAVLRQSLAVV